MMKHLTTEEIAAVIAGLEIGDEQRRHLSSCVTCRAEAAGFDGLVEARRRDLAATEPDWEASAAAVMDRLPSPNRGGTVRRPRWLRPALAAAAALIVAIGIGVLRPGGTVAPVGDEVAVEEILAEMDELLGDDGIPGFEAIDPWSEDLAAFNDNGAS